VSAAERRRRERAARPALDDRSARVAAFDLLARKAWSQRELTSRLRRRGAPEEVARAVVAELAGRGYLDDEAFAQWWAEARARGRRVGSLRLARELRAKGIPRGLATAAIEAAFAEVPEIARALEAGRRRLPALLRARPERASARLRDHLLRRGYPPAAVAAALRDLLGVGAEAPDAVDEGGRV
jgi:regulatory protein